MAGVQERQKAAEEASASYKDRPKAEWVSIKDGEAVKLVFLQEIDEGSPNYSAKNGTALVSLQHSHPVNWKRTAACTDEEGECYGCQNNWRQKMVFYANVLVDDGVKDPYVAIWSRGLGRGSVAQSLYDMAADDDFDNSISDKVFKFSRTGSKKDDTTYSLSPMPKPHKLNVEDYELYNLEDYVFKVAPERQEAYYLELKDGESAPAEEKKPVSASSINADW